MSFSIEDLYDFNYGEEANQFSNFGDKVHGTCHENRPCSEPEPPCRAPEPPCCPPEPPCCPPEPPCCAPEPPCCAPKQPCCPPEPPCPKPIPKKGRISVQVKLGCSDGEPLGNVRINLYKLCGCSPELVASRRTDSRGKVEFKCLEDGNYRVIEIIDKCFFEKPEYYPWNEICIDHCNKRGEVLVINKLKKIEKPCKPVCTCDACGCGNVDNCCCGNFDNCGCGCGCGSGCGWGWGCNDGCDSWIILLLLFGFCW